MEPIVTKGASLFVEKAELDPLVSWLSNYESRGLTNILINLSRGLLGGDWVGGEILLYQDSFSFRANSLNQAVLKDAPSITVHFSDIMSVSEKSGVIFGILKIDLKNRNLRIRSFGAKVFLLALKGAMRDYSSSGEVTSE